MVWECLKKVEWGKGEDAFESLWFFMFIISHQVNTEHVSCKQLCWNFSLSGNSKLPLGIQLAAPSPPHLRCFIHWSSTRISKQRPSPLLQPGEIPAHSSHCLQVRGEKILPIVRNRVSWAAAGKRHFASTSCAVLALYVKQPLFWSWPHKACWPDGVTDMRVTVC